MSTDERVAALLEGLGDAARPGPDPYARLLVRYRRSRRRRATAAGVGLVAAAAVAVTALVVPGSGSERAATPADSWAAMLGWAERLRQSPPRGAVAADNGYARGEVDRELARAQVNLDLRGNGYSATRVPSVVWCGRLTGTKPDLDGSFDGRAVLSAAPHVMGGWVGRLSVTFDESPSRAASDLGRGSSFWSETDPTDPSVMSVVRLGTSERWPSSHQRQPRRCVP